MFIESKSRVLSSPFLGLVLACVGMSCAFVVSACSGNAQSDSPDEAQTDDDTTADDDIANPGADDEIEMPISGTETDNPVGCSPPPSPPVTPSQFCEERRHLGARPRGAGR